MQGPPKPGSQPPPAHQPGGRRPSSADRIPIIELKPGMKNISTKFIVLDKGKPIKVAAGPTLQQFLVADHTAAMFLTLYDDKAEAVDVSDIIEIRDGYCSLYKGSLTLYVGKQGRISRIGEFCLAFDETINVSFFEWEEKSPGEFVRLSREQAEALPHHSRNVYVISGASPNMVPS